MRVRGLFLAPLLLVMDTRLLSREPGRNMPAGPLAALLQNRQPLHSDDLVVITNAESGVKTLTEHEAINIFMGRQKRLPNGQLLFPVEPVGDPELRARFYDELVHASMAQIRSYWARMWFSGQGQPPLQAESSKEVIAMVRANKGAIGFVPRSELVPGVKAVLVLHSGDKP